MVCDENTKVNGNVCGGGGKPHATLTRSALDAIPRTRLLPSSAELERMYTKRDAGDPREELKCRSARGTSDASSDAGSDVSDAWSASLRQKRSARGTSPSPWCPQLTLAQAPQLRTALRSRSLSRSKRHEHSGWEASLRGRPVSQNSSAAPSPAPSNRSTSSARSNCSRSYSVRPFVFGKVAASPARSVSCRSAASDMSLCSMESRFSRLSRRSTSRRVLSTAERGDLDIAAARMELQELRRHNDKAYLHAIHYPDLRSGQHSLELTVPREFNLSGARRSVSRSSGSAHREWSSGLRASAPQAWQPELTVPAAPTLRTASRSKRSDRPRSSSRHQLPREQAAIERHLQLQRDGAEERAEKARAAAQAMMAEAQGRRRIYVFKPTK